MLVVSYSPMLVVASVLVAVMAAFTALRLTNGLSALAPAARRPVIAKSAIALGGGIWSMHFVGMLAVRLPVTVRYDALPTLISALFAILVVGLGFIILHFGTRTWRRIVAAGSLTGLGIVGMHYLGMSAVSGNCMVAYSPFGIASATVIGLTASIFGLWLAYRRRTLRTSAIGAIALGLAISAMHYSAMLFTTFVPVGSTELVPESALSTDLLAMIVSLTAFVICGLFLLVAIPLETVAEGAPPTAVARSSPPAAGAAPAERHSASVVYSRAFDPGSLPLGAGARVGGRGDPSPAPAGRVPYERDSTVRFLATSGVAAVRADGHYTRLITEAGELFCPWSISRFEKAVSAESFIRTHRSYLANLGHVTGFRRRGDQAVCLVGAVGEVEIPVSRARVASVRAALGGESD
jgi:NO-binding membrane sensor protein with MHYT domain